MLNLSRVTALLAPVALAVSGPSAFAQSTPYDRSELFSEDAAVTDDLRRTPVSPETDTLPGSVLITNARLFDGTGAPVRQVDVLVEGKRIARIAESIPAEEGVRVIDARGRTVMPGLIDLHTHITYVEAFGLPDEVSDLSQSDATLRGAERLRIYVENGITTVRDTGSHGMAPFTLKRWLAAGRIPGPRLFAAGQVIVSEGGHGTEGYVFATAPDDEDAIAIEVNGPDEWVAAVRTQFKRGADFIKLASHYSPDEVTAAIEEAHRLGLRVMVDSESVFTEMAVRAGADVIDHPLPRSQEVIELMAEQGTYSVPTIVPYQYIIAFSGGYYGSTSRRFTLTEETMFDQFRRMRDAGVVLGVGTDLIVDWHKFLPEPYIQELRNFQRIGYSAPEALIAATRTSAEILGMEDKIGKIEVGMLADIIIVDGVPDEDIEDLANVDTVIVGGRVMVEENQVVFPASFTPTPLPFQSVGD